VNDENLFRAPLAAAQIDFLGVGSAPSLVTVLPNLQLPLVELPSVSATSDLFQSQSLSATPLNIQANRQARSIVGVDVFNADSRFADIQGQSWTVAVIDTGINPRHSFFGADIDGNGVADRIVYQYDFADGDANARDVNGHGSQTASIIASQDATLPGVAPGVSIISLKVFNDSGESDYSYVKQALEWVNTNADRYRIASVLMALGDNQGHAAGDDQYQLGATLAALADRGIIPVAAAGNDFATLNGQFGLSAPANDPNVVAVGAVYNANLGRQEYSHNTIAFSSGIDRLTPFSQRTTQTLFAPGATITGAGATENSLLTLQGSSQAAAYVAGAAILAQQLAAKYLGRSLTGSEFQQLALSMGVVIKDGDDEDDNVINTGASFRRLDLWALANKIWQMRGDISQPQLSITTSKNLAWENGQAGAFTVTRTGDFSASLSFNYRSTGTATNGIDYQLLGGTATFAVGQSTAQILVTAIDDAVAESGETVKIFLVAGDGYQLTKNQGATLAIVDNDSVLYGSATEEASGFLTSSSGTVNDNLVGLFLTPVVVKLAATVVKTLVPSMPSIELDLGAPFSIDAAEMIDPEIILVAQCAIEDAEWLASGLLTNLQPANH
jgi:Subtilase family/Calx-beta domain